MRLFFLSAGFLVCTLGWSIRVSAEIVVNWARNSSTVAGNNATLAPDGQLSTLSDLDPSFTVNNFSAQRSYNNLEALLGVSFGTLQQASVIAWEGNGGSAAIGGGWEATRFVLFDTQSGVTIDHKEGSIAPGVIATGTVDGAQYESFFGLQSGAAQAKMSWILLSKVIPNLDVNSGDFAIQMTSGHSLGFAGEGTADPDAIGVLVTAVPEPSSFALAGVFVVLGMGQAWRRSRLLACKENASVGDSV